MIISKGPQLLRALEDTWRKITLSLRQNDVAASFWRNNDVIIMWRDPSSAETGVVREKSQHHGRWCPGSLGDQCFRNYGTDR